MRDRYAFGYVVGVDGSLITLNLSDEHRGQAAAHRGGVSPVTDTGAVFGVNAGDRLMVLRVRGLAFHEPREAHRAGVGPEPVSVEPLRNMTATVIGIIRKSSGTSTFVADSLSSPPLGAEAFPLNEDELASLLAAGDMASEARIGLGITVRGGGELRVGLENLLARHVAVLGSTGQGKSCFTAAVLQQLLALKRPRLIVFDVNGEYVEALAPHAPAEAFKHTIIGDGFRIPYYALGRHGLSRLLLPSEKTQRPALNFALENLDRIQTFPKGGAGLVGTYAPVFFDDCRSTGADSAYTALTKLRSGEVQRAASWPHMYGLSCLVAESQAVRMGNKGVERNAFEYGNVAPLVTRINRCIEDPQFCDVIDVGGGPPRGGTQLDWREESALLVEQVFGSKTDRWKVHVVDLRRVAHDLMPLVLGSLLELFAFELFERGPGTYPTALILEEAHHYLRKTGDEELGRSGLAYERLAKEGRKFGVSIWLSTQRPAEVSPTVLAQCGTWVVFKLSGEQDLKAVANAAEWVDRLDISRIPGLPRQQALVFGNAVVVPTRVIAPLADPVPRSADPAFDKWLMESNDPDDATVCLPEPPSVSATAVTSTAETDEIPF